MSECSVRHALVWFGLVSELRPPYIRLHIEVLSLRGRAFPSAVSDLSHERDVNNGVRTV